MCVRRTENVVHGHIGRRGRFPDGGVMLVLGAVFFGGICAAVTLADPIARTVGYLCK
jgi:hypothetical protein